MLVKCAEDVVCLLALMWKGEYDLAKGCLALHMVGP